MHVAMPAPRDGVARPPVIPPGVAAARARRDAGNKRRTEKDLQVLTCPPVLKEKILSGIAWSMSSCGHGCSICMG